MISNPLLNAEIMAQDIAHALKKGILSIYSRTLCSKDLQAIFEDDAVVFCLEINLIGYLLSMASLVRIRSCLRKFCSKAFVIISKF